MLLWCGVTWLNEKTVCRVYRAAPSGGRQRRGCDTGRGAGAGQNAVLRDQPRHGDADLSRRVPGRTGGGRDDQRAGRAIRVSAEVWVCGGRGGHRSGGGGRSKLGGEARFFVPPAREHFRGWGGGANPSG